MNTNRSTISVFAGSSGGHLFPALAFAETFRGRNLQSWISLVTGKKAEGIVQKMPQRIFDEVYYLPAFPMPSGISLRSVLFLLEFSRAFILSSLYLSKTKPDLCVGFGSYISYPGMLLAHLRKIPTLIHEQNLIPGKATQMLANHMDCVTGTFDQSFHAASLHYYETIGLPIRSELLNVARSLHSVVGAIHELPLHLKREGKNLFRILIVGGSQGSRRLNELVCEVFLRMNPEEKEKIAVTHITGPADCDWVREKYSTAGLNAEIFPFTEKMHELYQKADMAITRAGANTLFELALFQLPAVVIPYPYAGAHQASNAAYFQNREAVITREENSATWEWLTEQILTLKNDSSRRVQLSRQIARMSMPNAVERLVDLAEQLLEKEQICALSKTI